MVQINPTVGDIPGNVQRIITAARKALAMGADLVVFSELVVSGYPPEDLVLKSSFQKAISEAVEELARLTASDLPPLLISAPWRTQFSVGDGDGNTVEGPDALYNAALLLEAGEIRAVRPKHALPNYGVFDEKRIFASGPLPGPISFRGVKLGVLTCEDMWVPDVVECLEETGAEILLVPNGSPYEHDKPDQRLNHAVARVSESGLGLLYINQVGGQDELVFDGASFALNPDSTLAAQAPPWVEDVVLTRWARDDSGRLTCVEGPIAAEDHGLSAIWQAMMIGLRDYVEKNGFPGILIGLSGGIDSAVSAAVAVDALGPEQVHCVMMPSPYTSAESLRDAAECAEFLGIRYDTHEIAPAMEAFETILQPAFGNRPPDVTEENIQARVRGLILMALSNKFGKMVLTTGNKSEMSVGYATLYGDMCGGFSVLKDIYKTTIYNLARWRNGQLPARALGPVGAVIPDNIITRAPTAELRPNQTDQDSLPPYAELDAILRGLIEEDLGLDDIVARGNDPATVRRVWRMLERAEYKRRQAPPGVKITSRAFGKDRRYPITNAFIGSD